MPTHPNLKFLRKDFLKMKSQLIASVFSTLVGLASPPEQALAQNFAETLCTKGFMGDQRSQCIAKVTGKKFDPDAVKVCETFSWPSEQEDCLVKIANMTFAPDVIRICNKKSWPSERLSCLLKLGDKQAVSQGTSAPAPQIVVVHTPSGNSPENAFSEAAALCQSLYYSKDQTNCMVEIKGKKFVKSAVKICSGLYYDKDKTKCLVAIRDAYYPEVSTKSCGEKYYDKDKIECLEKLSESWPGYAANPTPPSNPQPIIPGNPSNPYCGNSELIEKLSAAKNAIKKDRKNRALELLEESIKLIESTECTAP
jgi:hypothetical protein